jgi:hypothetical protein
MNTKFSILNEAAKLPHFGNTGRLVDIRSGISLEAEHITQY